MDIKDIISNPVSVVQLGLVALLVIERLVTGGYLRLMIGKKTLQDVRNKEQGGRDSASSGIQWDLMKKMEVLETHFNHETTAQYDAMLKSQEKILDTLIRIERDGIRTRQ
jgi:hypothetical protein